MSDKLDSMSELGEMESLRLAMDRYSKLMTTLWNILKTPTITRSASRSSPR